MLKIKSEYIEENSDDVIKYSLLVCDRLYSSFNAYFDIYFGYWSVVDISV